MPSPSPLHTVVLAAGQGKRMRSELPKVLHGLAGRPMLEHVVDTARSMEATVHVVHGHGGDRVREALAHLPVTWVEQSEQLGTGHAVELAMPGVPDEATVLVLYGDVPLVARETLEEVVGLCAGETVAVLVVELDDPTGYGRILRGPGGAVSGIVEEQDASDAERCLREINTGILAAPAAHLRRWLARLENDNVQGEYYLTDVVGLAVAEGVPVQAARPAASDEVLGVNDRVQLAALERVYQRRQAEALMRAGATVMDPARLDVRGEVSVGRDVLIDVNVVLEGRVEIGDGAHIGPNVFIRDARIGEGSTVLANCVVEEAQVGARCRIGPFARLRPQTVLEGDVHVGNFVEIKKTRIGEGSKANHLTYLGDCRVGRGANVGAGTITCNYDGANKHETVIGDGAFIGSGVELVAPVHVEPGATIGAGSTITRDAPAETLSLSRARQTSVEGWRRPVKKPRS